MQWTAAQRELEGRYTIVAFLGSGAGGDTFEALDARDGTRVALKRLELAAQRDWKAVELFQREARVLASLNHPAIPRHRDSFVIESERGPVSYLAHDFAPGMSLQRYIDGGFEPNEAEVIRIGSFLLEVLSYLHAQMPPVVHRDIKPANVIRSEDGRLWLVDFGAVRDATKGMGGSTVAGTYGYMAPEQFRGQAVPQSDLYGVGGTLLYLLSGRSPTDFPQRKLKIAFRGQVRCSKVLGDWLERALAPNPEARFPNARVALAALHGKSSSSSGRVFALLGVLGIVLAGAGGVLLYESRPKSTSSPVLGPVDVLPPRPLSVFKMIRQGRPLEVAHTSPIYSLAMSNDGTRFASGAVGSVKIWNYAREKVELSLAGQDGEVWGLGFTKDDKRLVSCGANGIHVYDTTSGAQVASIPLASCRSVKLTPDDKYLVAGGPDGVHIYDLATQAPVRTIPHGGLVSALAISPDGTKIASGGDNGTLKIWKLVDGSALESWTPHRGTIFALAFSPDGTALASAGGDHRAVLQQFRGPHEAPKTFSWTHADMVFGIGFSPDGNYVYSTGREGKIQVADAQDGHVVTVSDYDQTNKLSPVFSKDGRALLVTCGQTVMRFSVLRPGLHTKLPEPSTEAPVDPPPPVDREHELFRDAKRALDDYPSVSLASCQAKVTVLKAAYPDSPLSWIATADLTFLKAYRQEHEYDPARLAEARQQLDHAATLGPKTADWWHEDALLARAEKNPIVAREAWRQYSALVPNEPGPIILAATLDLDEGKVDHAVSALNDVIHTKPPGRWLQSAYSALKGAYLREGDADGADAAYQRLVALDPKNPWVHNNYAAFVLEDEGDPKRAIAESRAALALQDFTMARGNLAEALVERANTTLWNFGSPDDAIKDYSEAIGAYPGTVATAYYGRAAAYRRQAIEDHDPRLVPKARTDLEKALAKAPTWEDAKRAFDELDAVEAMAKKK